MCINLHTCHCLRNQEHITQVISDIRLLLTIPRVSKTRFVVYKNFLVCPASDIRMTILSLSHLDSMIKFYWHVKFRTMCNWSYLQSKLASSVKEQCLIGSTSSYTGAQIAWEENEIQRIYKLYREILDGCDGKHIGFCGSLRWLS